jgi:Tol biopolymer transport system component
MRSEKLKGIFLFAVCALSVVFFQNCSKKDTTESALPIASACETLDCKTSIFSLLVADLDGSNVSVIKTSSYQEMTHPRASADKKWVAYTQYNDLDDQGCARLSKGYFKTEIRATQLNGTNDKGIISPIDGEFNSNNYWIGSTNEFTYLSGPVSALKFKRALVDSSMNLVSAPTEIPFWSGLPSVFVPIDPSSNALINRIVYPALYVDAGSGSIRKSIFIMNLSDGQNPAALTLGRDHSGALITCNDGACANLDENDPKISPDGAKVAFMRRASAESLGANGFGFHLFVVPIATPLSEADISYSHIGSDRRLNDALPEWIDNDTLLFSTLEFVSSTDFSKNVYTMKSDGTQRTKISLPSGYRYADPFPFIDEDGKQRMILAAEKIGATCSR